MALFYKKPQTAEEILKLIKSLPDDESDKLADMLLADEDEDGKPDATEPETKEQIEEAEENIAENGADSQTEKDRIDESVAEQEKADGDEDSQDAKDRVDESEGTEEADEERAEEQADEGTDEPVADADVDESKKDEKIEALIARIDELEERLAKVVDSLDDASFGNHKAELTESDKDADSEDERIMKAYMGKQVYRK